MRARRCVLSQMPSRKIRRARHGPARRVAERGEEKRGRRREKAEEVIVFVRSELLGRVDLVESP